ncbi:PTS galactitol transporter subunit IIC [Enterococcus rivorum]|uniref:PTS galactitol transporter subunit IIC n=1 Tax=Enterococcus rivorum TaxID=762845 RepID=A0A1E5KYF5_9ENTE|nr:PTS transporter subunit IIC [Enterococcus rivorum]MBP2100569.1 PTS system galactitol-specific IIC component [Enterococcus rivorum]OEH82858.1 PTS galactitol transporter subunit IIC [Enterococcus rivorum]
MLEVLQNVLNSFGAAVVVPIMLFIVALFLKVPPKKAFQSALNAGVGLTGFNLIINSFVPIITPVINNMVEQTGINLPILDTGWQATSVIAYSTQVGVIFLVVGLALQVGLFLLKWTDVFMPSDMWNNYSFMVWGSMLYLITNNMVLAMACMIVQNLYVLLFGEVISRRWENYYQLPGTTLTAPHHVGSVWYAILMNWILNKLGADKVNWEPQALKKKMGFLGEPVTLGLVLGLLIGVLGNLSNLGTLEGWGTVFAVGLATAAVMAVFPKVAGIFASAFTSLTQASKKTAKGSSDSGREWKLSVNDAVGYGEPATLITGLILIPIMVVLAMILPGNKTLPLVDLIALPYMVEMIICVSKGNVFKGIISGMIWFSFGLYMCTFTAPYFTEVAMQVGVSIPEGAMMITSFGILNNPTMGLLFLAFLSQNYFIIAGVVVLYFVLYFAFRKNKERVWTYLENA